MDRDSGASFGEHPAFASLDALLQHVAAALLTGSLNLWGEWEPYVDEDGYLDWLPE